MLVERGERLVDRAVVVVVVDDDLRPARDVAGQAQGEPVGVGGRDRELPPRQAEPPAELVARRDRVLDREHEGDPAPELALDSSDRRTRRVAGHRAGVTEAEVDVVVSVDVLDVRPAARSTKSGKPPAHLTIQFIGTPSRSEPFARSWSAIERGLSEANVASSRSIRRASRERSSFGAAGTSTSDGLAGPGRPAGRHLALGAASRSLRVAGRNWSHCGRRRGGAACRSRSLRRRI